MLLMNTEIHHWPCFDPRFFCRSEFNVVRKSRTAVKQYGTASEFNE
jgi:hypothetical protein